MEAQAASNKSTLQATTSAPGSFRQITVADTDAKAIVMALNRPLSQITKVTVHPLREAS